MNIGQINRQSLAFTVGGGVEGGDSANAPAVGTSGATAGSQVSASAQQLQSASPAAARSAQPEFRTELLDRASVEKLVRRIGEHIRIEKRALSFTVDEELGKTIVTVVDRETDEVIRQIPSEELLRIARTIRDISQQHSDLQDATQAAGLLISEQA